MGAGCIYHKRTRVVCVNSFGEIEFFVPDHKQAEIGEYLLSDFPGIDAISLLAWNKLLKDYKSANPIEELLKDVKQCRELTTYIRQGVPMKLRWQTWKSYINLIPLTENEYKYIPVDKEIVETVIKKDIDRTFPDRNYFDKNSFGFHGQFALLRVLGKFATICTEISYCQGMNFIVGLLLMVSGGNETESFGMLEAIIHHFNIKGFYTENMPELKRSLMEFDIAFQSSMRNLYMHFKKQGIFEDMWVLKWFITMFSAVLPLKCVLRVWDILMVDGILTLQNTALAILKYFERDLMQKDTIEILQFFNNLIHMEINPTALLQPLLVKRNRPKLITKIAPFCSPIGTAELSASFSQLSATISNFSNISKEYSEIEPNSASKVMMMHCEITEDPNELPLIRAQNVVNKSYKKVKYRRSLNVDDSNDTSTMVEESKIDEGADMLVILNDLITEDID